MVSGSDNDPLKEMAKWDSTLESSYGKRNFIVWDVTKEQIYSEIGKLLCEKAKMITQTNAKVAEIDRRMNDLATIVETAKDGK